MTTEMSFVVSALRAWKSNVDRADKLFGGLSPELLEEEIAPGKNRLIYLWGHLAAVNDGLLKLLGIGEKLHPEFDEMVLSNSDKSIQLTVSGLSFKAASQEVNQKLWDGFLKFSTSDWARRHTAVSGEDFKREPHRSRFTVLLGRTAHLAYHVGQATLALPRHCEPAGVFSAKDQPHGMNCPKSVARPPNTVPHGAEAPALRCGAESSAGPRPPARPGDGRGASRRPRPSQALPKPP
jgi:hypothetical protein